MPGRAEGIAAALDQLRLRLLDLTGRNRLLNFKPTPGKSLQFAPIAPLELTFQRLLAAQNSKIKIAAVPDPTRDEWIQRNGRMAKPEAKEHAATLGLSTEYELARSSRASRGELAHLQALYFADDLGKHCRKLEREARLAIEETGANMLYLVLGFLEYQDSQDSDRCQVAPLICVPVRLEASQEGQRTVFKLTYTNEEIEENLSLREKLKRDFQLTLPEFPDEESGIEDYLIAVERMAARLPQWRVRRSVTLALLSFANMLLVRDLNPENWIDANGSSTLVSHPIVQQLFSGETGQGSALYATEAALDEIAGTEFPIVFDADSSQHSALLDVMQGRSMVIEGPPGTGKSQTIANIIAACISEGKRVLFVSEKLAALQVVKGRLEQAGLEAFLMELHSNKTTRKAVLDSLSRRLEARISFPRGIEELEASHQEKKLELKRHSDLMGNRSGNMLGCSVHEILWRAERARARLGSAANVIRQVEIVAAQSTPSSTLQHSLGALRYLGKMFQEIDGYDASQPFWGFDSISFVPGDELRITNIIRASTGVLIKLSESTAALAEQHGFIGEFDLDSKSVTRLSAELSRVTRDIPDGAPLDILPSIFCQAPSEQEAAVGEVQRAIELGKRAFELERLVEGKIKLESLHDCPLSEREARVVEGLGLSSSLYSSLPQLVVAVQSLVVLVSSALSDLAAFAETVGLKWTTDANSVRKVDAVAIVAEACPVHCLALRHPGLMTHNLLAIIDKLASDQKALTDREAAIGESFYLDHPVDDESLREAILALREGAAWYRFLQPRWRRAVKLHRTLQRRKTSLDSESRLIDLENIEHLRRDKRDWIESPILKRVAGASYDEFRTSLGDVRELAAWLADGRNQLTLAGVDSDELDLHALSKEAIEKIVRQAPRIHEAVAVVSELDQSATAVLPGFEVRAGERVATSDISDVIGRLRSIAMILHSISNALEVVLVGEYVLGAAFRKLELARELLEIRRTLASSSKLPRLLGSTFPSSTSALAGVSAALEFGIRVKKSALPENIKRRLWGSEANATTGWLQRELLTVQHHWDAVNSSLAELQRFGNVEKSEWALAGSATASSVELTLEKFSRASSRLDELVTWCQYTQSRNECIQKKLEPFVRLLEERTVPAILISEAYSYCFHASIAEQLFRQHRSLAQFRAVRHDSVRGEYRDEDKKLISIRGRQIAAKAIRSADPPQGATGARVDDKSEMHLVEYLRHQIRPRVSVRALLRRAAGSIQALKPCFMMGPQAVAQFLKPGAIEFDVVVMDEASQMRPEEAIGAAARGAQLVVVGDPKQLPPTSFFSRAQADSDEQEQMAAVDVESILDVASTHFRPVRSLRWHYRSRHESLIAFSNAKFYDGKMVVFPSPYPRSGGLGVRSHYVPGAVYESQMNQLEAVRTVDFVVDHVVTKPDCSLGVVTLNIRQRDLIAELLEERLKSVASATQFRSKWEKAGQPLFVKNLENVQGDERDCIIVSTTFGRPPGAARPHQNFGPISQQGGWRRLNVLFTRARRSVLVVTSLKDTDIVVTPGSTPRGTEALRDYLTYASTGVLRQDLGTATQLPPESDFEEAVIAVLSEHGYVCVPQVGVAGFRIDIGVRHPHYPHLFLAGIECDGAAYHSGITVRDRDRIRQEILESLGWEGKLWRIWSTEWFRNPGAETRKLLSFLAELAQRAVDVDAALLTSHEAASTADDVAEFAEQSPVPTSAPLAIELVTESAELEVQVDDLVSYISLDTEPDREVSVRISQRLHEPSSGIIAAHTPLAESLLGAMVNEEVVLRIPAQADRRLKVTKIQRPGSHSGRAVDSTSAQPTLFD